MSDFSVAGVWSFCWRVRFLCRFAVAVAGASVCLVFMKKANVLPMWSSLATPVERTLLANHARYKDIAEGCELPISPP